MASEIDGTEIKQIYKNINDAKEEFKEFLDGKKDYVTYDSFDEENFVLGRETVNYEKKTKLESALDSKVDDALEKFQEFIKCFKTKNDFGDYVKAAVLACYLPSIENSKLNENSKKDFENFKVSLEKHISGIRKKIEEIRNDLGKFETVEEEVKNKFYEYQSKINDFKKQISDLEITLRKENKPEVFLTYFKKSDFNYIGKDDIYKTLLEECKNAKFAYNSDPGSLKFFLDSEENENNNDKYVLISTDKEYNCDLKNIPDAFFYVDVNWTDSFGGIKFFIAAKFISREDLISKNNIYLKAVIAEKKEAGKAKNKIYLIWEGERAGDVYATRINLPSNQPWAFFSEGDKKLRINSSFNGEINSLLDKKAKKLINTNVVETDCYIWIFNSNKKLTPIELSNVAVTFKCLPKENKSILETGKCIDITKLNSEDYFIDVSIINKDTGIRQSEDKLLTKEGIIKLLSKRFPTTTAAKIDFNTELFEKELGSGNIKLSGGNTNPSCPETLSIRNEKGGFSTWSNYSGGIKSDGSIKDVCVNAGDEVALALFALDTLEGGGDYTITSSKLNDFEGSVKKAATKAAEGISTNLRIRTGSLTAQKENSIINYQGVVEYLINDTDISKPIQGKNVNIRDYFNENYKDEKNKTWEIVGNTIYTKGFNKNIENINVALTNQDKAKSLFNSFRKFLSDIIGKNTYLSLNELVSRTPLEKLKDDYVKEIAKKFFTIKSDKELSELKTNILGVLHKEELTKKDVENILGLKEGKITESVNIEQNEKSEINLKYCYVAVKVTALKNIKILSDSGRDKKYTELVEYIPQNNTEINDNFSGETVDYSNMEKFIQEWALKKEKTEIKTQTIIPVNNYYDTLSGMHPYIEASFRYSASTSLDGEYFKDGGKPFLQKVNAGNSISYFKLTKTNNENDFNIDGEYYKKEGISTEEAVKLLSAKYYTLNSLQHPFFKSLSIVDKGFKTFTLVLFDKDFGSYNLNNTSDGKFYYSLDSLIRGALASPTSGINTNKANSVDGYEREANTEIENEYLKFDNELPANMANIKLRWGYADYNSQIPPKNTEINGENYAYEYYNGDKRNNRWWDVRSLGGSSDKVILTKGINENKEIQHGYTVETSSVDTTPRNSLGTDISFDKQIDSTMPTTSLSREYEFMITGFSTSLKENGIEYTIKGIESKDGQLLSTRFLQRYSEITACPVEALYILERIFNEDSNGYNIKSSPVKILFQEDAEDSENTKLLLNQEYDFNMLSSNYWGQLKGKTTYENASNGVGSITVPKALKNITVSFGGNDAQRNYAATNSRIDQPLYKSVASLMDEFCASCPPKEKNTSSKKIYNEVTGEEIVSETKSSVSRPLKWYSFRDEKTNIIYVVLYYRGIKPQKVIRKYTWGPNNPNLSCVTSLNIENKNEFAVLSGIKSFDGKNQDGKTKFNDKSLGYEEINEKAEYYINKGVGKVVNIAGANKDAYDRAFSNCMYSGKMTILGDPFFAFDRDLQPYTYAISLDVLLPMNERMARREFPSDLLKFGNKRTFGEGNQLVHESSGYYVISEINHEISSSGYTTTLDIVSYPNIKDDVIKGTLNTDMLDASLRTF